MKSILSTGINLDLRGTPTGYVDDSNYQVVFLLGGKQQALAAYRATELHPTNANVIAMREKGHTVLMRSSSMPVPVRNWIMRQHKKQAWRVQDYVRRAGGQHIAMTRKSLREAATKGEYTYAKLYAKHVKDNFFEYFPTWDAFDDCRLGSAYRCNS